MGFAQHTLTNVCTSVYDHRTCIQVITHSSTNVTQDALPNETFDYTAHESSGRVRDSALVSINSNLYTPIVKTMSPTRLPPTSCMVHSLHVRMSSLWPNVSSRARVHVCCKRKRRTVCERFGRREGQQCVPMELILRSGCVQWRKAAALSQSKRGRMLRSAAARWNCDLLQHHPGDNGSVIL